ncbi:MAG: biopolymer transporter ExbD [Flavobacteriaceae bacterium]
MSKFTKKKKGLPAISTASLPDIVFMLLFFFMVTTVMRETDQLVDVNVPTATEVKKLERKSLVSYIYVGKPKQKYRAKYGKSDKIQLNDKFASVKDIGAFILAERASKKEEEVPYMTTSIKADKKASMGIISDIKLELRDVNALKINYATHKGGDARE